MKRTQRAGTNTRLGAARSRNRRRRRIRLLGAVIATLALAAATAAAIVLGTRGGRAGNAVSLSLPADAVPWTSGAAPAYTPPAVSSPASVAAKYAPCRAASLAGHLGAFGLGAGSYTRYLAVTNTGGGACTLSHGPSAVYGLRANGTREQLAGPGGPRPDPSLIGPANLQPGQNALVALSTSYGCAAPSCGKASYTAVDLRIGTSGTVRVAFPRRQPLTVINGVAVSTFGVRAAVQGLNNSPLNVLTVSITMPATLTAGTTASYAVTLHNPTGGAVSLSPCPSYSEFLAGPGTGPTANMHRYYLNCQAVSRVPAGGSVTFAIRTPVPAAPGQAKLGWALQGTSVEGGGTVTIAS